MRKRDVLGCNYSSSRHRSRGGRLRWRHDHLLDADKHQHKVRLAGIDAPESGQAFGRRSKQTLSDCAFGKQATLIGDKVDRYGRTVSKVMVAGVDCNLRQVVLGQAWHYKAYEREQSAPDRDAHANAELDARKARSGLWADAKPVPPWEWRNGDGPGSHKSEKAAKESSGQCDCATSNVCVGKRGSEYCLTASGSKKYMR